MWYGFPYRVMFFCHSGKKPRTCFKKKLLRMAMTEYHCHISKTQIQTSDGPRFCPFFSSQYDFDPIKEKKQNKSSSDCVICRQPRSQQEPNMTFEIKTDLVSEDECVKLKTPCNLLSSSTDLFSVTLVIVLTFDIWFSFFSFHFLIPFLISGSLFLLFSSSPFPCNTDRNRL